MEQLSQQQQQPRFEMDKLENNVVNEFLDTGYQSQARQNPLALFGSQDAHGEGELQGHGVTNNLADSISEQQPSKLAFSTRI